MVDAWLSDLAKCAQWCTENPHIAPSGTAAVYGSAAVMPEAAVEDVLLGYLDTLYKVNA